jgi:hypothetical protein
MSGLLLSRNSFKLVFKSDKFVLSINRMFMWERYLSDDIFKMNVITIIIIDEEGKNNAFFLPTWVLVYLEVA